jgi:hypothetical protein
LQSKDKYIKITVEGMEKIAKKENLNALEKLIEIFQFSASFRKNRFGILQYLHEEKNAHLHLKFERKIPPQTVGPISQIIIQGVNEGVFNTKYPEDAARAIYGISAMVLQGIYNKDTKSGDFKNKYLATFDFIERVLGAKQDIISKMYKNIGD